MKCGPDGCPILGYESLSPAAKKEARKAKALAMSNEGFSYEQIGLLFGVSKMTISNDLANCKEPLQSKPAKTASNPKGAGRHAGRRKGTKTSNRKKGPKNKDASQLAASLVLDQGKGRPAAAAETGLGEHAVQLAVAHEEGRRQGLAEPQVDRADLSLTAQEKFDAVIRRYKQNLDLKLKQTVQEEIQRIYNEVGLPAYERTLSQLLSDIEYARSRGVMTRAHYMTIWHCLHPDSRKSVTDQRLQQAFTLFEKLRPLLLSEAEDPTPRLGVPKTFQELMAQRAKRKSGKGVMPVRA
jgi:transposase